MGKYAAFTQVARDQGAFLATYRRFATQEWGSLLLEGGTFTLTEDTAPNDPADIEIYLGEGAQLSVWDGLDLNVHLTLPREYVESLTPSLDLTGPGKNRRLYWSSPNPPAGLGDPPQNPLGHEDVILAVPESLKLEYVERRLSGGEVPERWYLEIWDQEKEKDGLSELAGSPAPQLDAVEAPSHYTWLGRALADLGLSDAANVEAWDVLDAAFPDDPHLWNCGKYLLRQGRKGGEDKRLEDLRKARQYLDRTIARLEREA